MHLRKEYTNKYFPRARLYALVAYNVIVGGICFYYTLNFGKISKKLFKPKTYKFKEIVKYGTI